MQFAAASASSAGCDPKLSARVPPPPPRRAVRQVSVVGSAAEAAASAPPGGSVNVVVNEGLQLLLPLAGLFDVAKEIGRLTKQKAKVRLCNTLSVWRVAKQHACTRGRQAALLPFSRLQHVLRARSCHLPAATHNRHSHLPAATTPITSLLPHQCNAQVEKELGGILGRLNNPKFVEKASAEYIEEVRGQAADAQERLASIEAKLAQVAALQA